LQEAAKNSFHQAQGKIIAEPGTTGNGTMEKAMQQQGDPSTAHIKPRKPIVDTDYYGGTIDTVAALFIRNSYEYATVVDIDGHFLTAVQLRGNVTEGGYIADEVISFQIHVVTTNMHTPTMYLLNPLQVINAFVHLSNVETDAASYITTFEARKLADSNLGAQDGFTKKIVAKCKGRHLVRNTDFW
jgi:hypothetical protein